MDELKKAMELTDYDSRVEYLARRFDTYSLEDIFKALKLINMEAYVDVHNKFSCINSLPENIIYRYSISRKLALWYVATSIPEDIIIESLQPIEALLVRHWKGLDHVEESTPYERTHLHFDNVVFFSIEKDNKEQTKKVLEEAAEVYAAYDIWHKHTDPDQDDELYENLIDEIADVIQASLNLAWSVGFDRDDIEAAIDRCTERNKARGRF